MAASFYEFLVASVLSLYFVRDKVFLKISLDQD